METLRDRVRVGGLEPGSNGVPDRLPDGHRVRQRDEYAFTPHGVPLRVTVVGYS